LFQLNSDAKKSFFLENASVIALQRDKEACGKGNVNYSDYQFYNSSITYLFGKVPGHSFYY
jgi:hypothetical protein